MTKGTDDDEGGDEEEEEEEVEEAQKHTASHVSSADWHVKHLEMWMIEMHYRRGSEIAIHDIPPVSATREKRALTNGGPNA